ncbi:hypothetical protein B0T25DRAFT_458439 [Lasiosphaeria hispida]|uniref:Uncharacterized protein n=1 Tax=Lasiosphaeria hispida TaxID=260671 RepID=A0AAJ0HGM6_9PEZI|nr:hypothetical protein B0T25DRAFT_458439 [Lasiosphaeria hispida]
MPATEIITIINNSGKVLSTGKQLVSIFKEAQAAYRDRKDAVRARRGIQRAKTFDVAPREFEEYDDEDDDEFDRRTLRIGDRPHDDRSQVSHRSHRSRRSSHHPRSPDREPTRPALTMSNLKTHSEVSGTAPSAAPKTYRPPYAEESPRDMQLSRPNLAHAATMPLPPKSQVAPSATGTTPASTPRQSMLKKKEIDMHMAYGELPPDLATRVDLGPVHKDQDLVAPGSPEDAGQEAKALTLVDRIEDFLEEAHCIHHTASSMIANLQQNPEAAAAVALTLAELSVLVGKMSPSFLGVLKGSSPAIFALLASPQFLIGTSIAVGVTVVMFGGWKIVKKMREGKMREAPFEMTPMAAAGATVEAPAESATSYEEALVLEEEMSTIETWRRGIEAGAESADIELMSAEADRALRDKYRDDIDPDDSISRVGSTRSRRTHRSRRHRRRSVGDEEEVEVPERKSSKKYHDEKRDGGKSEVAESVRSHRTHRSSRSEVSHSSRASKRTTTTTLKAIEDKDEEEKPGKKKNMLKQLFKKMKDKDDKEKDGRAMSVLV